MPAGGALAGTYPNPTIAENAIGSSQVTDGTLTNDDLAPSVAHSFGREGTLQHGGQAQLLTLPNIGTMKLYCAGGMAVFLDTKGATAPVRFWSKTESAPSPGRLVTFVVATNPVSEGCEYSIHGWYTS